MPRPRNPDKKQQLSIRLRPELRTRVFDLVNNSSDYESVSEFIGLAIENYLRSPKSERVERSA